MGIGESNGTTVSHRPYELEWLPLTSAAERFRCESTAELTGIFRHDIRLNPTKVRNLDWLDGGAWSLETLWTDTDIAVDCGAHTDVSLVFFLVVDIDVLAINIASSDILHDIFFLSTVHVHVSANDVDI